MRFYTYVGKGKRRESGWKSIFILSIFCAHHMHGLACVSVCLCVCLRVSRQQGSEAETDVKQATLGLHVFTAV